MALEKLRKTLLTFLLMTLVLPAFGAEITDINIQGLKRTKPHVMQSKLEKFKDTDSENFDTSKVITELQKTGLFSNIDVSVSGSTLNVTVEEKFSFIPLPFAFASSDSWGGGLVLMDNNAFGIMDKAAVGGFITKDSWRALVQYNHVQQEDAFCGWYTSASGGRSTTSVRDEDGDLRMEYDNSNFAATIGLSKKLTPWLKAYVESGMNMCKVDDDTPHSELIIPATFGLTASTSEWDGTFLDTTSLSVSATENFNLWHESYYSFAARALWEQHLVQRLRLITSAAAFYAPDVPIAFARNQGAAGIYLMNSAFRVSKIVGGNAGLEWGIKKFKYGMPTIYTQYQVFWADSIVSDDTWGHGPVLGFKFYLSKIAFPAVDIFASYNARTGILRTSAGAGFSF